MSTIELTENPLYQRLRTLTVDVLDLRDEQVGADGPLRRRPRRRQPRPRRAGRGARGGVRRAHRRRGARRHHAPSARPTSCVSRQAELTAGPAAPRGRAGSASRRGRRRSRRAAPPVRSTRWHGTTIGIGLVAMAEPDGPAAPSGCRPARPARGTSSVSPKPTSLEEPLEHRAAEAVRPGARSTARSNAVAAAGEVLVELAAGVVEPGGQLDHPGRERARPAPRRSRRPPGGSRPGRGRPAWRPATGCRSGVSVRGDGDVDEPLGVGRGPGRRRWPRGHVVGRGRRWPSRSAATRIDRFMPAPPSAGRDRPSRSGGRPPRSTPRTAAISS